MLLMIEKYNGNLFQINVCFGVTISKTGTYCYCEPFLRAKGQEKAWQHPCLRGLPRLFQRQNPLKSLAKTFVFFRSIFNPWDTLFQSPVAQKYDHSKFSA